MWIGTTVTGGSNRDYSKFYYLSIIKTDASRFLSIEPFCYPINGWDFHNIDLLIVGGLTGPKPFKPPADWINELYHDNIHIKKNAL
jgi:protein gp37